MMAISTFCGRERCSSSINLVESYVENVAERRIVKARGSAAFRVLAEAGLGTDVNGPPEPRHVDIAGWSVEDKDVRMMQATEIADKMELHLSRRATY